MDYNVFEKLIFDIMFFSFKCQVSHSSSKLLQMFKCHYSLKCPFREKLFLILSFDENERLNEKIYLPLNKNGHSSKDD